MIGKISPNIIFCEIRLKWKQMVVDGCRLSRGEVKITQKETQTVEQVVFFIHDMCQKNAECCMLSDMVI